MLFKFFLQILYPTSHLDISDRWWGVTGNGDRESNYGDIDKNGN